MIDGVREVTHIAATDSDGVHSSSKWIQDGVKANKASNKELGLCAGVTNAIFATTTEVYP